jgi:integral membrane protein
VSDGINLGKGLLDLGQPPLTAERLAKAAGNLKAYRFMAFLTGTILVSGCLVLILKASTSWSLTPLNTVLWIAHGWLYVIYVIVTAMTGFKLRWPLPRYALIMLAGTVPTASFFAEHFVTRAARAAVGQPVSLRD